MSKEYYDESTEEYVVEFDDDTPKEALDYFSSLLREARLEREAKWKKEKESE
jgi:hypothetical protein